MTDLNNKIASTTGSAKIKTDSSTELQQALDNFVDQWTQFQLSTGNPCEALYESEWPSSCFSTTAELIEGQSYPWQPVKQVAQDMFQRLSNALECDIHPDLIEFYSRYWSGHLTATSKEGDLELLQVWNQEDMERLRSNLVGHALSKKKQKKSLSFFIGLTAPDDGMLCIENDTGEIWYEMPGKRPIRKVANNLAEFIDRLSPRAAE